MTLFMQEHTIESITALEDGYLYITLRDEDNAPSEILLNSSEVAKLKVELLKDGKEVEE